MLLNLYLFEEYEKRSDIPKGPDIRLALKIV